MAVSNPDDDQWFAPLPAESSPPTSQRPDASEPSTLHTAPPRAYSDFDQPADRGGRVLTLPASTPAVPPWQAVLDAAAPTTVQSAPDTASAATSGPSTPRESWLRRNRAALAVTGSLAAIATLATTGVLVLTGPDEAPSPVAAPHLLDHSETAAPTTTTAPTTTAPKVLTAAEWCAQQTGGQHASADSPDPELAVIGRVEDAYYLSRDMAAVNAQLAPGVTVKPDEFAAAIAAIPAGTDHCVLTTPLGPSQYRVTLIERRPGGEQKRFASAMTTQRTPDGTSAVITAIGRAPE